VLMIPVCIYLASPSSAVAAQAALVRIHEINMSSHQRFYTDTDPSKLAEYLKTHLGFAPAHPQLGRGMSIRGCCLAHFRGGIVGSYVVDTPRGTISIIVVKDRPETLNLDRQYERNGRRFWSGSFARCHMVVVRLKDFTYCAIGELSIPHKMLSRLLERLVPAEG